MLARNAVSSFVLVAVSLALAPEARAQTYDSKLFQTLRWRNIGPNRMRMTMVTLRADRDTAGRTAVRAFVSAKCSRRRAGVLRIRTSPLVQRVSPAVTG